LCLGEDDEGNESLEATEDEGGRYWLGFGERLVWIEGIEELKHRGTKTMKQCTKCKGTNIQQAFVGWHNLKEDTIDGERYYENQYFNADDDVYFCKDCDETVNVEGENEPK